MDLLKLSRKQADCPDDGVRKLMKAWDDRLVLSEPKLVKRYLGNMLRVHIHMRIIDATVHPYDFCASFGRPSKDLADQSVHPGCCPSLVCYVNASDAEASNDDVESVMFIPDVECVDDTEWGFIRRVSVGHVRLQRLDECCGSPGDTIYFSFSDASIKTLAVPGNGELMKACMALPATGVALNQLPHEMIERRSQVMDDFTGTNGECERWISTNKSQGVANGVCGCIEVLVGSDYIGVRTAGWMQERVDFNVEFLNVMFGPFDLLPTTGERM